MIKEKDLIELGFERQNGTPKIPGLDYDWHYYTLNIEDLCLISDANDKVKNDSWKVYIFDYDLFKFTELGKLKLFIDMLNEIKQ